MTLRIAFRTDNSVAIGAGHLARCLTLADRLAAAGCEIRFICRNITGTMREQVRGKGYDLTLLPPAAPATDDLAHSSWLGVRQQDDGQATITALGGQRQDWLVVDHYGLDRRWEDLLALHAARILVIDDLADRPHRCDALLDQNLQDLPKGRPQTDGRYAGLVPQQARLLLGTRYALLRPQFRAAAASPRPKRERPRLNLFFGSTDPKGMTLVALAAVRDMAGVDVDVIVGADNPHREAIAAACRDAAHARLHIQPDDVAGLLAQADLALGAGGTTSWERCCLGLPTLIVSVADNQRAGTEALARSGAAIDLGTMETVTPQTIGWAVTELLNEPQRRAAMRAAALALVDGQGADRVALHMLRDTVVLRPAAQQDCERAWTWRNAPSVRAQSFDTAPVPMESHVRWWTDALQRADRILLVAAYAGRDVGILRYDCRDAAATVSIYVDPDLAGLGLGRSLLRAGDAWLRRNAPRITTVTAAIRSSNQPSLRSFSAAGYRHDPGMDVWIKKLYP